MQLIRLSPPAMRGGVIAIHGCMKYIGQSAAPIVLGIVLACFGIGAVFVAACIFGALLAFVTFAVKRRFAGPAAQPSQCR